jgi:hypothetical protein
MGVLAAIGYKKIEIIKPPPTRESGREYIKLVKTKTGSLSQRCQ